MKTSDNGKNIIKKFEGCELNAYRCPANVWTIGYGHTKGVKQGDRITQEQADQYLTDDLAKFEYEVERLVKVPLTQNKFDALVSLTFNIGGGQLSTSTLLRKLNTGDYAGAANQFLVWNKITLNGVKKPLIGLSSRRQAEKNLFDKA